MILTKDELIQALRDEVRVLLHLISKVDPLKLDYRPTPKQRSTMELLRYFVVMGPVHVGPPTTGMFDMDQWRNDWNSAEASARTMNLEQVKEAIAGQPALFAKRIGTCSEEDLRAEMEIFGSTSSRGLWLVKLVLCHFAAYRMQLFLYLKASGGEDLSTMNLWAGTDAPSSN